jgi:hypothetical protein
MRNLSIGEQFKAGRGEGERDRGKEEKGTEGQREREKEGLRQPLGFAEGRLRDREG